jgi:archaellum component FlaF (FlaF/FlaG flagellin family)
MIATILLIAFTVAVGGIISIWMTSFARTSSAGTEVRSEALTRCTTSGFEVISVKSATNYTYVTQYSSDVKIYPISVVFSDGSVVTSFGTNTDYTVTAGEISPINLTGNFPSGATSLRVKAYCEYGTTNISLEAECKKGDNCWS